jgi:hypothetical protein
MRFPRTTVLACAMAPALALAAPTDHVHALRLEVAALQLDHALQLTPEQARTLLPLLRDAQGRMQALQAQRAAAIPAVEAALAQAVADLRASGTVAPSTVAAMQAARGTSARPERQELKALLAQARQVLTPAQVEAFKSTKLGIQAFAPTAGPALAWQADGHRPGRRFFLVQAVLSEPFLALVQARAG